MATIDASKAKPERGQVWAAPNWGPVRIDSVQGSEVRFTKLTDSADGVYYVEMDNFVDEFHRRGLPIVGEHLKSAGQTWQCVRAANRVCVMSRVDGAPAEYVGEEAGIWQRFEPFSDEAAPVKVPQNANASSGGEVFNTGRRWWFVCGHSRHGKDTFAQMVWGLNSLSSSRAACEAFIFAKLKDRYGYKSPQACHADRHHHQTEWFDLIRSYNASDETRLAKAVFARADCYCGIRSKTELEACRASNPDTFVIWVDRSQHVSDEPAGSNDITAQDADLVIDNNGRIGDLWQRANKFRQLITGWRC